MSSTTTARRQSSGIRSRRGCITCRSKKVKCDEQSPACGRCLRLKLLCEWSNVEAPARRSNKSYHREKGRPSKEILPNLRHLREVSISGRDELVDTNPTCHNRNTATIDLFHDWIQATSLEFDTDFLFDIDSRLNVTGDLGLSHQLEGPYSNNFPGYPATGSPEEPTVSLLSELTSPLNILRLKVTTQEIALSPAFEVSHTEQQALHHYQIKFSASRLTKNPLWCTHTAILCQGSQIPMVMHLLISVSLLDLGMRSEYDENICQAAQRHFRTGAHLLIDRVNEQEEPHHISVLTSFYFLYLFMTKRKDMNPSALDQLSKTVLNYVKQHRLDTLCVEPSSPHDWQLRSRDVSASSGTRIEFIARMIIFLYYEDIMAAVQGYGGFLARYLQANKARTKDIYQISSKVLESYWGSEYPDTEVIDDVENMVVMELIHDLMDIYQYVTDYWQISENRYDEADQTEKMMVAFEKVLEIPLSKLNIILAYTFL